MTPIEILDAVTQVLDAGAQDWRRRPGRDGGALARTLALMVDAEASQRSARVETVMRVEIEALRSQRTTTLALLARMLDRVEDIDDCGPSGFGWKSEELKADIGAARALLKEAR